MRMDKLFTISSEAMDTSGLPVVDPLEVSQESQDRLIPSEHEKMALIHDDAVSDCIARVLEILSDVEPYHVTALVTDAIEIYGTGALERVLHTLFDDPRYPKVQKRGNRNLPADNGWNSLEDGSPPEQVYFGCSNYGDHDRPFVGGQNYVELTLVHLVISLHSLIHIYIICYDIGTS
jgi:E3 ubiquitin-protein ligase RNF216